MTTPGQALAVRQAGQAGIATVTALASLRPGDRELGAGVALPKHAQAAALIRAWIADGTLGPGASTPSGAALARITGYSSLTCRRGLKELVKDGTLVPGPSPNARPRVPPRPGASPGKRVLSPATRALSARLSSLRHAAGLTQPELAELVERSITTVGHAETGRLWQGRSFWESADDVLSAGGELLRLHDAWQAESVTAADSADGDSGSQDREDPLTADEREAVQQAGLLFTFIAERIVGHGPTRADDLAEFRYAVHVIQRAVEAQAAARAYPREFRLLGAVIPKTFTLGAIAEDSHPGES